jgi:hypothetical protein
MAGIRLNGFNKKFTHIQWPNNKIQTLVRTERNQPILRMGLRLCEVCVTRRCSPIYFALGLKPPKLGISPPVLSPSAFDSRKSNRRAANLAARRPKYWWKLRKRRADASHSARNPQLAARQYPPPCSFHTGWPSDWR